MFARGKYSQHSDRYSTDRLAVQVDRFFGKTERVQLYQFFRLPNLCFDEKNGSFKTSVLPAVVYYLTFMLQVYVKMGHIAIYILNFETWTSKCVPSVSLNDSNGPRYFFIVLSLISIVTSLKCMMLMCNVSWTNTVDLGLNEGVLVIGSYRPICPSANLSSQFRFGHRPV